MIGVTRPGFFGTTLSLRAPDAWIPFMMQPVVRYSQNASNSNSADPRETLAAATRDVLAERVRPRPRRRRQR